jgi:hypothetical protein
MRIEFRLSGVREAVRDLEREIESSVEAALLRMGDDVASVAKATHPYQNRTGLLEKNTEGFSVLAGNFWRDSLEGGVIAATDYASFVDDRPEFAFLEPAWRLYEPQAEVRLDAALSLAAERAGWVV